MRSTATCILLYLLPLVVGFDLSKPSAKVAIDRRGALVSSAAGLGILLTGTSHPRPAVADGGDKGKIVVFGGSGYVGAHVDQLLTSQGYTVLSVSRSSSSDQADKIGKILGKPLAGGIQYATLDASSDDLSDVLKGATAVVSCVGIAPGGANQRDGNGKVNVRIADAAKAAGISRFVYVGVASELANGPAQISFG